MVMLAQLRENQAERKIGRILMETIKQMTYTFRIFISKRKKNLFSTLRNELKEDNFGQR